MPESYQPRTEFKKESTPSIGQRVEQLLNKDGFKIDNDIYVVLGKNYNTPAADAKGKPVVEIDDRLSIASSISANAIATQLILMFLENRLPKLVIFSTGPTLGEYTRGIKLTESEAMRKEALTTIETILGAKAMMKISNQIILENHSLNTRENAERSAEIINQTDREKQSAINVLTIGFHTPRSGRYFDDELNRHLRYKGGVGELDLFNEVDRTIIGDRLNDALQVLNLKKKSDESRVNTIPTEELLRKNLTILLDKVITDFEQSIKSIQRRNNIARSVKEPTRLQLFKDTITKAISEQSEGTLSYSPSLEQLDSLSNLVEKTEGEINTDIESTVQNLKNHITFLRNLRDEVLRDITDYTHSFDVKVRERALETVYQLIEVLAGETFLSNLTNKTLRNKPETNK